jgi:hypothetical protein
MRGVEKVEEGLGDGRGGIVLDCSRSGGESVECRLESVEEGLSLEIRERG